MNTWWKKTAIFAYLVFVCLIHRCPGPPVLQSTHHSAKCYDMLTHRIHSIKEMYFSKLIGQMTRRLVPKKIQFDSFYIYLQFQNLESFIFLSDKYLITNFHILKSLRQLSSPHNRYQIHQLQLNLHKPINQQGKTRW